MLRLAYRFYRLGSSLRYRLSRRLTPAGWLVVTGLVVTTFIGVDLEQSVASQTFAVLFSLSAVAMFWALLFRGRFVVERLLPRFGSVGQPFCYRVCVRSEGRKRPAQLELFEELADPRPTRQEFIELHRARRPRSFRLTPNKFGSFDARRAVVRPVSLPPLRPREAAEASVEVLPLKRGPLRFEKLTLARRDPFGLFRGFVRVP